jgi:predicted ATP-dependent serine protease
MNKCSLCGHERKDFDIRCPECGSFYPTIAELIAEEEANEEKHSFRGHCKRILGADDVKQELLNELSQVKAGLTKKALFTIFVIIAFVFALTLSVL